MNCLIVGTGAIGIALGATLCKAGCSVALLARGETYEAIAAGGIRRTGLFGEYACPPETIAVRKDYGFPAASFDYVLISVKTMSNPEVAAALAAHREILKPGGRLVLLQNGWGNDAAYLPYFSKEELCSARVITGFQRTAPNVSNITVHTAPILLGSLYGLDVSPLEPLAAAISRGGIPSETTEDVTAALWAKMLYNCTLNPLGAVLGVHYGALGDSPAAVRIMNQLMDELFAVMDAAGYRTWWPNAEEYRKVFYSKLLPDTYHHNSSTLQDIRKKHPTEIDTLTGKVLELAARYGVSVPANTMLYWEIKAIEDNY